MIAAEDTALLLLAAGRSTRFTGEHSKLDEPLDDLPIGLHVVRTLAPLPFARRIAIVKRSRIDYAAERFRVIVNDDSVGDMASSVRLGIAAVGDAAAAIVVLADMPCISMEHVRRLLDAGDGADAIVASSDGQTPRPPALFGRARFAALSALTGDRGARDLIRQGQQIVTSAQELADIDTLADLATLRRAR